jgi:hypothetical protein
MGILTGDTLAKINTQAVDAGANFLVGSATSAFDPNFGVENAGVMTVASSALAVASGAANIVGSSIQTAEIAANIVAEGVAYLSSYLTEYISKTTVKLLTIPTAEIASYMAASVSELTLTAKDILKGLADFSEVTAESKTEEVATEETENMTKTAGQKVKEVAYTVTTVLKETSDKLNSIATYCANGSDWVEKQVDKYTNVVITQVTGKLDKTVEDFNEVKLKWAKSMGEKAAQKIVQPLNIKLQKAQKGILDKVNAVKKKAYNKAKALVAKAIMKIKGLLGG